MPSWGLGPRALPTERNTVPLAASISRTPGKLAITWQVPEKPGFTEENTPLTQMPRAKALIRATIARAAKARSGLRGRPHRMAPELIGVCPRIAARPAAHKDRRPPSVRRGCL